MLRIERSHSTRRVTWWTLLGLLLIPLIVAGGLFAAARPNTQAVKAAVVNLDKYVTINGQIVPLGRQLAASMVDQNENISWTLADLPSAERGLTTGEYSAVVVIPENFSAAATSFSENKADKAKQATIDIRIGQNSPVTDAVIAQQIARIASDLVNTMLTENYLDNIYLGFNTMGEQFVTMKDAARQLADGAAALDDGIVQAADGSGKLADGMDQFAAGMPKLTAGIGELSSKGGQLMDGVVQFTDGSVQVVNGVGQLGAGLRQFESQVRNNQADYSQLQKLKDGAAQLAQGTAGVSTGVNKVSDMLKLLTVAKLPTSGGTVDVKCPVDDPETCKIFAQVMTTLQNLANGQVSVPPELFDQITCPVNDAAQCATFNEVIGLIKQLASGTTQIPQEIIDAFKCPATDPQLCSLLLRTYLAGFQTGTGVGWAALNAPDPKSGYSLKRAASEVASGASQFSKGIDQFVDELPKEAAKQQAKLADGIAQVAQGAETIVTRAQPLVSNASTLSSGATQFKAGLSELATQVQALPDGAAKLAQGTRDLSNGLVQAQGGSKKLADGLDLFATKLSDGASQVPSYSEAARAQLKKVVSRPIITDTSLLANPLGALLAVLLAAGLWLGAMASYLVMRPVPSRALTSSRPTWQLTGAALLPGMAIVAVQAVLLGVLGALVLGWPVGHAAALVATLLLAGVTFVVVNHAVAAWFGGWGRLVFLGLATLAVAVGLTSGVPGVVSGLAALSPVTPALNAIRTLGTGASLTEPVGALLLWLVLGLLGGYISIARHRQWSVAQFVRARAASTSPPG